MGKSEFCGTTHQSWCGWADIYAVEKDDGAWYVKIHMDKKVGQLTVLSCHFLEHDIVRADGTLVKRR